MRSVPGATVGADESAMLHVVDARSEDPDLLPVAAAAVLGRARHVVVDGAVPSPLRAVVPDAAARTDLVPEASPDDVAATLTSAVAGGPAVWMVAGDPADPALGPALAPLTRAGVRVVLVPGPGPSAAVEVVDPDWFRRRPLYGTRVVVTRAAAQAEDLVAGLERLGGRPVLAPVIAFEPPPDGGEALRRRLADLGGVDWLVVTSPNGADRVLAAVRDARQLGGVRVAAIGPGTAARLRAGNVVADLIPERYVAEGLLEVFPDAPPGGGRVVLARASEARDVLPDGLAGRGWAVEVVPAYRTVSAPIGAEHRNAVATSDVVTFTASSTVRHFLDAFGPDAVPPIVACIGPVTAATARDAGLDVRVEAPVHTIAGLLDALASWARGRAAP